MHSELISRLSDYDVVIESENAQDTYRMRSLDIWDIFVFLQASKLAVFQCLSKKISLLFLHRIPHIFQDLHKESCFNISGDKYKTILYFTLWVLPTTVLSIDVFFCYLRGKISTIHEGKYAYTLGLLYLVPRNVNNI